MKIVVSVVGIIGMSGNIVSFKILMKKEIRCQTFNQLLACLCIIDIIVIFFNVISCVWALEDGSDNCKGKMNYFITLLSFRHALENVFMFQHIGT